MRKNQQNKKKKKLSSAIGIYKPDLCVHFHFEMFGKTDIWGPYFLLGLLWKLIIHRVSDTHSVTGDVCWRLWSPVTLLQIGFQKVEPQSVCFSTWLKCLMGWCRVTMTTPQTAHARTHTSQRPLTDAENSTSVWFQVRNLVGLSAFWLGPLGRVAKGAKLWLLGNQRWMRQLHPGTRVVPDLLRLKFFSVCGVLVNYPGLQGFRAAWEEVWVLVFFALGAPACVCVWVLKNSQHVR